MISNYNLNDMKILKHLFNRQFAYCHISKIIKGGKNYIYMENTCSKPLLGISKSLVVILYQEHHLESTHSEARWQDYPSTFEPTWGPWLSTFLYSAISPSLISCVLASIILTAPEHIRTQTDQSRGNWFPELALFCSTEIIWSHLTQTSSKWRLCQINTAMQLGPWKKPYLETKEPSTVTCFMMGFVLFCSYQFH